MARRVTTKEAPNGHSEGDQTLRYEVERLIKRVEALEANRPGRKAKPLVALRQDGVCAVSPDIDSATCEDSSIFRYQQGCHGDACKAKQHAAYQRRKDTKAQAPATPVKATPVEVDKPKRASRTPAKTAPVKKMPVKRQRVAALAG